MRNRRLHDWARTLLLRDAPLSIRLLVYSALLVVIPMISLGLVSYRKSSEVLRQEANQYSQEIMEQVQAYVEDYFRDLEITMIRILNDPDIRTFMRARSLEEAEQNPGRRAVLQVLQNASYSRSDIAGVTIMLDGVMIVDSTAGGAREPAENVLQEHWYKTLSANGDTKVVTRLVRLHENRDKEPVITLARRLVSPMTLEPAGLLMIDVNYKRLKEAAEMVRVGQSGYLMILDDSGNYVYHPDADKIGRPYEGVGLDEMTRAGSGSFRTRELDRQAAEDDFLAFRRSGSFGWTLAAARPYADLMAGNNYIARTIVLAGLLFLAFVYIVGVWFARSITRPVYRLKHMLKHVENGNFDVRVPVAARDELGYLSLAFNHMTARLGELVNEVYGSRIREAESSLRQKETELKALQSQINPHFLFNSLETIRGMALGGEREDIADMSAALAKLMRYSLSNESAVTLQKELEISELYLRIQKHRFGDLFDYRIEIPEWAKRQRIVKFALQPIIENAVIHGVENSLRPVRICVYAERETATSMTVVVCDDGPGIPPDRLAQLQSWLAEANPMERDAHIGLINVHRRIQHVFGEAYGLQVESGEGKGVTVRIRLPLDEAAREEVRDHGPND